MSFALFRLGIIAIVIVQVACLGSKESGEGSVEDVAEADDDMSPPSAVPGWTQYNWRNEFNFSLPSKLRTQYIQSGVKNHHEEVGMMEAGEEDVGQDNSTAYWEVINSTTTSIDIANAGSTEVIPRHVNIAAAPIARRNNETIPLDEVAEDGDEGSEEVEAEKNDMANVGEASIQQHVEVPTLPTIALSTEVNDEIRHQPKPFSGKGCKPKLDLVYLLDTSGIMVKSDSKESQLKSIHSGSIQQIYQEHVKWAVALVDSLPLEKDIVRVAAIQYAGFPLTEFALGTYPDARDIREHLMKINFQSGITRTGYALRKAEAELFHIDRGAREGAKKAVILFTDGLSIDDPSKPAEQLRNLKGVSIYVVNLSSDGFEQEIDRIAGNRNNVFGRGELDRLREAILTELEDSPACLRHGMPRKSFTTSSPPSSLPALLSGLPPNSKSSPTTPSSRSPLPANSSVFTTTGTSPPTSSTEANNVGAPPTGPVVRSSSSTVTRADKGAAVSIARESPTAGSTTGPSTSTLALHIENGTSDAQEWEYEEEEVQPITSPINISIVLAGNESIVEHQAGVRPLEVIDMAGVMGSTTPSATTSTPTITITITTTTPQKFADTTASRITAESPQSQTPISTASTISNAGSPPTTVVRSTPHRVRHLSEHIQHLRPVATIRHRSKGIGTIREFPILLRDGNGTANKSAVFLSALDIASQEEQTHNRGHEMSTLANFPTLVSLSPAVEQPTPHPATLRVAADSNHRIPSTKSGSMEVWLRRSTTLQPRSLDAAHNFRLHAAPTQHLDSEEDQKRYLENILEQIQLGNKAHRVALLQFAGSEIQKTEWNYDTHNSSEALMKAFGRVRLITGTTFIGKALESALHILNSRRREVPSVAVLLSDGFSQDDASQAAEKLRRMLNLDFYACSMSELSNTPYLIDLLGTEDHVFVGERRAELKELLTNRIHCQHR